MRTSSLLLLIFPFVCACNKDAGSATAQVNVPTAAPDVVAATATAVTAQQAAKAVLSTKTSQGFVVIPAGKFIMGQPDREVAGYNDAPQHEVVISSPFEMMEAEVTQAQYKALMATSPAQQSSCGQCPVTHVSWYQATMYCNELSRRQQLPTCYTISGFAVVWPGPQCQGYRLPTEAEWEYAARAGSTGSQYDKVEEIAWYDENAQLKVHEVKGKKPNAFGLYDMLGNVAEWVWDWQAEYPRRTVGDPTGPGNGENRVFRGGSWRYSDGEATANFRSAYGPQNQVEFIGFRCVRTLTP